MGSEHQINGIPYPMEMELIFYDGNFKSVNEVEFSEEADAMAAVSFFFEVKKWPHFLNPTPARGWGSTTHRV